jgi:hypothetical protein
MKRSAWRDAERCRTLNYVTSFECRDRSRVVSFFGFPLETPEGQEGQA